VSRAAQECVNNVIKHSGASHAYVELDFSSDSAIRYSFQDDGVGSEIVGGGFGLIGMKERVILLEGDIVFQTAKGKGFGVEISLPG
jgi:two-component system sensor histidine kinase DegS